MDTETGENFNIDDETGEILTEKKYDNETGEHDTTTLNKRIKKFRINLNKKNCGIRKPIVTRDLSPAIIVLLPTLFMWPGIATVGIAVLEVMVHMWAHRKNKRLGDSRVYYRSPMHIVASEFCALCRDQKDVDEITRIQDKRINRFKCNYEYVKRIVT